MEPDQTSPDSAVDISTPMKQQENIVQELISLLREDLKFIREMMQAQQRQIETLQKSQADREASFARFVNVRSNSSTAESAFTMNSTSTQMTLQTPPISTFSGKTEDQSSRKVKLFVYRIKKVGTLFGMSERDMVEYATCYLTDIAAKWMMRLEARGCKPSSIDDLQNAMMAKFVPTGDGLWAESRWPK